MRVACHVCPVDCESRRRRSLNTIQTFYYINLKAPPTPTSIKNKGKKTHLHFFSFKIFVQKKLHKAQVLFTNAWRREGLTSDTRGFFCAKRLEMHVVMIDAQ